MTWLVLYRAPVRPTANVSPPSAIYGKFLGDALDHRCHNEFYTLTRDVLGRKPRKAVFDDQTDKALDRGEITALQRALLSPNSAFNQLYRCKGHLRPNQPSNLSHLHTFLVTEYTQKYPNTSSFPYASQI